MIRFLLLLLSYVMIINGVHFDGGTITWQPINPYINSSIVPITITQSYAWTASIITCDTNVPISTTGRSSENANLTCVVGCSTDGGYSTKPISILTDCQTVNSFMNVMTSQRSVNINLAADAYFSVAFTGGYWIAVNDPPQRGLDWSLISSIDLRMRPEGFINTPPVAIVVSPQYAVVNQTTQITIPVSDLNAGDDVRCRWSVQTTSGSSVVIDECAGICYPSSVPSGTTLSNCTISFIGDVPNVWYGVAVQVEDFINDTSLTPMSSVPVQFLIYVMDQPTCGLAPVILPLELCFDVQVGVSISFNMSAMTLCNPNISDINNIIISSTIVGMNVSDTNNYLTNESVSYATFTWTPLASQLGSQQLCVLAYTTEKVQSQQYCVTFNVIASSATCITTTTTSTTSETTTVTFLSTIATNPTSTSTPIGMITIINPLISSNISRQRKMRFALFLSILLLSLCCSCFLLYYWCWNSNPTHRRWIRRRHKLREEMIFLETIQKL